MPFVIQGYPSGTPLEVDTAPKAARVILYGPNGSAVVTDGAAVTPLSQGGVVLGGVDYKTGRNLRASPDGQIRASAESVFLEDQCEGAALNTTKWISTATTMTATQAAGVLTMNAASTTTGTTGIMIVSHRWIPYLVRSGVVFRTRIRPGVHTTNNLIEAGFGSPASVTAAGVTNGAFWRKDGTGQWVPVISIGVAETLGTPITNATFIAAVAAGTDYCFLEVFLENCRAKFTITKSDGATIVNEQWVDFPTSATGFTASHINGFIRIYNAGTASPAVLLNVAGTLIASVDPLQQRSWPEAMVGEGQDSLVSPTAFTQLANYANSTVPASATLSNTAAGYATLGGQYQFVAVAGAETDYALFAIAIPSPYALCVTGVQIATWNMGAAAATTPTLLQWSLGFNSSAVSLATAAPYSPMRITLGSQSIPVGAAIGANVPDVVSFWGRPGHVVQPGRFFHVILKMPVGTATASQVIRGLVSVHGYVF